MDSVRLTDTRLVTSQGSRWWLGLTVNQFAAGSIPACGAVARSGVGFQRLTVNEFVAGSIPVGHLSRLVPVVSCKKQLAERIGASVFRW